MQARSVGVRRSLGGGIGPCVAAAFAAVSTGCVMEAPLDQETETVSSSITAAELLGRQITGPLTFENRCVDNVETAFAALPGRPSGTMRYRSRGGSALPPDNAKLEPFGSFDHHIQGITRFPVGFDNDRRWLAVSRAHLNNRAGFFLVHLGDADGADGSQLLLPGKSYPSNPVAGRETKFYYPLTGTGHPGGMQAFGQFLALASESETAPSFIDFYDFRGGPGAGRRLQRVLLGSTPSFPVARVIGGVAVARLKDGRFLMFVLGQDKKMEGWFYVSNNSNLTSTTQWLPVSHVKGTDWTEYQNVSLVTECNSNRLYVVATGNPGYASDVFTGADRGDLFRLSATAAGGVAMTKVVSRTFASDDGFCTFRAAATVHADKNGKLILYCHAHHANTDIIDGPDSKLKMAEWSVGGCLSTQTACGSSCCSQGSACTNGSCCPVANSCGSACCTNGTVCKNASRNLCCDSLSVACGSSCCGLDQQCVNNTCVTPPPPPPPPPPSSCGLFQRCTPPNGTCPGSQICFGTGCCGILR
jgi:hypothetical protein